MAGNTVNGSGNGARSGARTLSLLAAPINVLVLQALSLGPAKQADLRRFAGEPAHTTLRSHLRRLSGLGAIARRRRNRFPGVVEFELTDVGADLVGVARTLERWLELSPEGPLQPGTGAAKSAIKALAEGWSTTILRALAAGPLSLTDLDHIIGGLSYPSLERRMGAMRLAGQIEARRGNGRGTPYAVTRWMRQAVAPVVSAIRWERRHLESAPALTRLETETTFLLALPLLSLPCELSGSCRMAMEIPNGPNPHLAGVMVTAQAGRIASCATRLHGSPDAWASGSPERWMAALIDADSEGLEVGGDSGFVRTLLEAFSRTLFDPATPPISTGT